MENQSTQKKFKTIEVMPSDIEKSNQDGGNPWNQNDRWPGSSAFVEEQEEDQIKRSEE